MVELGGRKMNARVIDRTTGVLSTLLGNVSAIGGNILQLDKYGEGLVSVCFYKECCVKYGTLKTTLPGDILMLTKKGYPKIQMIVMGVEDDGEEFAIIGRSHYIRLKEMLGGK